MGKIGIIYAISTSAGELCKAQIIKNSSNVEVVTHECPPSEYKSAGDDLSKIAALLIRSVENLYREGAETIIIAANSVHRAFDLITEPVKIKYPKIQLISIIDTAVNEAMQKGCHAVAVFGSNSTMTSNMYQNKLHQLGIKTLSLTSNEQRLIHSLISTGISEKTITPEQKEQVIKIANRLKKSGCETIIFGCTELSLVFNADNLNVPVIDSNLSLALAAIQKNHDTYHSNRPYFDLDNFSTNMRAKL